MRSPALGKDCARITSTSRRLTGGASGRRMIPSPRLSAAMPGTTEQPTPAATSTLTNGICVTTIVTLTNRASTSRTSKVYIPTTRATICTI
jgi:hypothetical protein